MTWLDPLLAVPVTVVAAGRTTDVYGQDMPDWEHPTVLATAAWVQPTRPGAAVAEEADWSGGRDQQTFDALAWLPAGTPITGRDRLEVDGELYEVIGPPLRRRAPWADREHHVRAELRRLEGPGDA